MILRHKTGECLGNFEVDSIPGLKELLDGQYAYRPCPPDIGKLPIHPHLFMHLFLHPGDHLGTLAVERLPKKLNSKLSATNNSTSNTPVGWGIYIVDGYNWTLIRLLFFCALALCITLGVGWSVFKQDVQGGMGIGSFVVALLVSVLSVCLLGRATWDTVLLK